MRLNLWVDALEPQLGGIGRYTWELCKGLSNHPAISELTFFARGRLIDQPERLLLGAKLPKRRRLQTWAGLRKLRKAIVHGPNYFLPPYAETGVITVHDLSVFRYPETHPVARVQAFEQEFARSLRRANHVITDTETVRQELIADFGVNPSDVTAIHLGVDRPFFDEEFDAAKLSALGLDPRQYGLCIAALEPRKKILELLRAWRDLPPALRNRYPLVLAGNAGWRNEGHRAVIDQGVAEGWLRHLGFIEETLLRQLYKGARLFIYPSTYEGFGLPALEAMASGAPVLVAGRSCLPEVCGNAAAYVDPDDHAGFTGKLAQALEDERWHTESRRLGRERAATFTWQRCIEGTVEVYREAWKLFGS